jgi:hypothetical protein
MKNDAVIVTLRMLQFDPDLRKLLQIVTPGNKGSPMVISTVRTLDDGLGAEPGRWIQQPAERPTAHAGLQVDEPFALHEARVNEFHWLDSSNENCAINLRRQNRRESQSFSRTKPLISMISCSGHANWISSSELFVPQERRLSNFSTSDSE